MFRIPTQDTLFQFTAFTEDINQNVGVGANVFFAPTPTNGSLFSSIILHSLVIATWYVLYFFLFTLTLKHLEQPLFSISAYQKSENKHWPP